MLAGCHTKKTAMRFSAPTGVTGNYNGPIILFLSGTITFDSIASSYSITIDKQQQFEGRMNLGKTSVSETLHGLYCQQTDAKGDILCQQEIDNPLSQVIEYFDGNQPSTKTIIKDKAPFFVRIQLNTTAKHVIFMYNNQTIQTINI